MSYSLVNYFGEVIGEEFEIFEEALAAAVNEFDTTGISERSVVMFCGKIEDKDGCEPSVFEESRLYRQLQEELKQGREAIEMLKEVEASMADLEKYCLSEESTYKIMEKAYYTAKTITESIKKEESK